jgi:hypothetical protein
MENNRTFRVIPSTQLQRPLYGAASNRDSPMFNPSRNSPSLSTGSGITSPTNFGPSRLYTSETSLKFDFLNNLSDIQRVDVILNPEEVLDYLIETPVHMSEQHEIIKIIELLQECDTSLFDEYIITLLTTVQNELRNKTNDTSLAPENAEVTSNAKSTVDTPQATLESLISSDNISIEKKLSYMEESRKYNLKTDHLLDLVQPIIQETILGSGLSYEGKIQLLQKGVGLGLIVAPAIGENLTNEFISYAFDIDTNISGLQKKEMQLRLLKINTDKIKEIINVRKNLTSSELSYSDKIDMVKSSNISLLLVTVAKYFLLNHMSHFLDLELLSHDKPVEDRLALKDKYKEFFGTELPEETKHQFEYAIERDTALNNISTNYGSTASLHKVLKLIDIVFSPNNLLVIPTRADQKEIKKKVMKLHNYFKSAQKNTQIHTNIMELRRKMATFYQTVSELDYEFELKKQNEYRLMPSIADIKLFDDLGVRDRITSKYIISIEDKKSKRHDNPKYVGVKLNEDRNNLKKLILKSRKESRPIIKQEDGSVLIFVNYHIDSNGHLINERGEGSFKRARDIIKVDTEGNLSSLVNGKAKVESWDQLFENFRELDVVVGLTPHKNILLIEFVAHYNGLNRDFAIVTKPGLPLTFTDFNDISKKMYQQAEGLAYLNQKGITHNDHKRENCLIDETGEVKIMDLGLAMNPSKGILGDPDRAGGTFVTPECLDVRYRHRSLDSLDNSKIDSWAWAVGFLREMKLKDFLIDGPTYDEIIKIEELKRPLDFWFRSQENEETNTLDRIPMSIENKTCVHYSRDFNKEDNVETFQRQMIRFIAGTMFKSSDLKQRQLGELLINCIQAESVRATMDDIINSDYYKQDHA